MRLNSLHGGFFVAELSTVICLQLNSQHDGFFVNEHSTR